MYFSACFVGLLYDTMRVARRKRPPIWTTTDGGRIYHHNSILDPGQGTRPTTDNNKNDNIITTFLRIGFVRESSTGGCGIRTDFIFIRILSCRSCSADVPETKRAKNNYFSFGYLVAEVALRTSPNKKGTKKNASLLLGVFRLIISSGLRWR